MKKLLFNLLLFIGTANVFAQNTIDRTNLKFELPNKAWTFNEEKKIGDKVIRDYKRTPLDNSQKSAIPNISIITEHRKEVDVMTYFAVKRTEMPLDIETVILPKELKMKYNVGICYFGSYSDDSGSHKRYITFLNNKKIGVTVICDVDDGHFKKVDKEFLSMLSSIQEL